MNIRPKKHLSQNFLIDKNIIKEIIELANIKNNESIIEIGPGRGALTKELIKYSDSIIAYELDDQLSEILKNSLPKNKITILNEDFLKSDLSKIDKSIIVANIPYKITSQILFKIFRNSHLFKRAIIMVQSEVANRVVAKSGDKKYGKLSVVAQYYADVKIGIKVPATSFFPAPKVQSSVLSFEFKELVLDKTEEEKFLMFVKNCFRMPRKTLFNNLKKIPVALSENIIKTLSINNNSRPQDFSLDEYIILFKSLVFKDE